MGVEIEFETSSPYTVVTSRAMERYIFQPPGRLGRSPAVTRYTRQNGDHDIGKVDVLELRPGDRLRIGTQGGGGLGDPLERPPGLVAEVSLTVWSWCQQQKRSTASSSRPEGMLDEARTEMQRAQLLSLRPTEVPTFTFGAARDAYRQQWPLAFEDALAQVIADQPGVLRQFLHHEVKRVIADRMARGWRVEPADVAGIAAEVSRRMNSGYPTRAAD
jgi:N-methylhydantoinase B